MLSKSQNIFNKEIILPITECKIAVFSHIFTDVVHL